MDPEALFRLTSCPSVVYVSAALMIVIESFCSVSPAGTRKNTQSAKAGVTSPQTPKMDPKNDVRPHPSRERTGREEPGGGDADAEEESEDHPGFVWLC